MGPQAPAVGPGPHAPPWLQPGAILEGRQLAGPGAGSNSRKAQGPAANGHSTSTALVLHQSASLPVRQAESARAAARGPAPNAENALTVVPDRHAMCLREEEEVAAKLQDLVIAAEGYRVTTPNHQLTQQLVAAVKHGLPLQYYTEPIMAQAFVQTTSSQFRIA